MNYTKFKLKPREEIAGLVNNYDALFIYICGKCYEEFVALVPDECGVLRGFLAEQNKNVVGSYVIDFLCNKEQLQKRIAQSKILLGQSDALLVLSCGIGVQTVADLLETTAVYAVGDTMEQSGQHGISLCESKCAGCATCFLSLTQGICPLTNCSKELLNGPCGGAKNGKCEVSKDKDCGWEKIYKRLKRTQFDFAGQPVQFRKYNKIDFKQFNDYNNTIRSKRAENFYGGIYPFENKEHTADKPIQKFPDTEIVVIPLHQHLGNICESLVKVGDVVKIGQKIGDSKSFMSSPIHSSVSGKVIAVEPRPHPVLDGDIMSVVIQSDGKNILDDSVKPNDDYENITEEHLRKIIHDKGIVGLGGAQCPTHVKLRASKPIDTLLLNGCECEPYITADDRLMVERPREIIVGMQILLKILKLQKGIVAIESNKQKAIEVMKETITMLGLKSNIEVAEVKTKYPQGSERMLIKKILNRDVPLGGLPPEVGVVVNNVGTSFAVYNAVVNGIPLIKRIITVSGENCTKPGNYEIKIGTPIKDIINYCFSTSYPLSPISYSLRMGGPMMGVVQKNIEAPIIKGTTCLLALNKFDIIADAERNCIKCGRCVDVCPMELYPLYYWYYKRENSSERLKELEKSGIEMLNSKSRHSALNCIECGCCEYICSSKLSLVDAIKETKKEMVKNTC